MEERRTSRSLGSLSVRLTCALDLPGSLQCLRRALKPKPTFSTPMPEIVSSSLLLVVGPRHSR